MRTFTSGGRSYQLSTAEERVTDEQWQQLFLNSYDTSIRDAHIQAHLEDAFRRAEAGAPLRIRTKCLTTPQAKHDYDKQSYWRLYQKGGTPSKAPLCTCSCHQGGDGSAHPDHPVYGRICPGKYAHLLRQEKRTRRT